MGGRSAQDIRQTPALLNKANTGVAIDSKIRIAVSTPQ
jgi:hypothetical protein